MSDVQASLLRTLVPIIYALLIKAGIEALGVREEDVQAIATALATMLVYAAIRLGEQLEPKIGWLLGYPVQPRYIPDATLIVKGEVADEPTATHVESTDEH